MRTSPRLINLMGYLSGPLGIDAAILRLTVLFVNFFLIVTALYQIKPASRSLLLDVMPPENLPYVWMASAALLLTVVVVYQYLLRRYRRQDVMLGASITFVLLLWFFHWQLQDVTFAQAVGFYLLVDLMGVVLVEQFWSLTNSVFQHRDGKTWYGLIGAGGLLGGVLGSALASLLIHYMIVTTADLLLIAAMIITITLLLTLILEYVEPELISTDTKRSESPEPQKKQSNQFIGSPYLILIAATLFIAQLISPIVEYQFMQMLAQTYAETEQRTAMLSLFFSVLSGISIAINLVLTPLILHYFGVCAGLMMQPIVVGLTAYGFGMQSGLFSAAVMKLSDRGLSYSMTRASRELLYSPLEISKMYQAKAWIDMFGSRSFKLLGAVLVLLLTQWMQTEDGAVSLSAVVITLCVLWLIILFVLNRYYESMVHSETDDAPNEPVRTC